MESAQRELMSVLLGHVRSLGLISENTYSKAEDLVRSVTGFPELFRYPVRLIEEAGSHECTENPR